MRFHEVMFAALIGATILAYSAACPWGTTGTTCDCYTGWTPVGNGQCCSPNAYYQTGTGCVCTSGTTWNAAAMT
jgi:hypothetical protein